MTDTIPASDALDIRERCGRGTDSIMQAKDGKLVCECCLEEEETDGDNGREDP